MQEFFRTNYLLVSFGHGLVFFLLGFAIAITLRQTPRTTLQLARGLKFVAAFGVLYGIAEWGTTFIPLQASYLSAETLLVLRLLRLVVLVSSFTALGWFGHSLLSQARRLPAWPRAIPLAAALLWLAGLLLHPLLVGGVDKESWLATWEIFARVLMGIPAAVVGSIALGEEQPELQRSGFKQAQVYLGGAAVTMVVFAFTVALMDPRPIAGVDALERDVFFRAFGVPLEVLRATAGLILTVFFVLVLEALAFDTRRRLDEGERRRAMLEERHRIGQELQDGVIQRIYAATLYIESAATSLTDEEEPAADSLQSALSQLNNTVSFVREHLVAGGGLPLQMSPPAAGGESGAAAADVGSGGDDGETSPNPDRR